MEFQMKVVKTIMMITMALCVVMFVACSDEDKDPKNDTGKVNSCEGCHTNYNHLKEVHSPDVDIPVGGCGGDAIHIEPYDRVYLGGAGFTAFKASAHGKIECTQCHNGVGNTDDKLVAHSGDFIKKPSHAADEKCSNCHAGIVAQSKDNIHNGLGQMRKVTQRMGLAGAREFDMLPQQMQDGYKKNCAICHASCGECHVIRPNSKGGGLANGHNFVKTPDMLNVCVACHSSRGGHAFLGVASGTIPDVHLTKAGYNCMSCHTKDELHGDGNVYEHRYDVAMLPQCTDCHSNVMKSNSFHSMHAEDFSCNVCHSQSYNSCGSCHIGGEGTRIMSHQDFKIGINPIRDNKRRNFNMALLRRAPSAPDSWEKYGQAQYTDFAAHPTWNYTTPHNILLRTAQTTIPAGKPCSYSCHIVKDDEGNFLNRHLYLFDTDLQPWEQEASKGIIVNGKLPANWGVN